MSDPLSPEELEDLANWIQGNIDDPQRRGQLLSLVQTWQESRVIAPVEQSFICERCGKDFSKISLPGRPPKFCDDCQPEAHREKARERMREYRKANPPTPESRAREAERARRYRERKKGQPRLFD